jgi:hypothetical protein
MAKTLRPLVLLLVLVIVAGCAARIPHAIVPDFGKRGTRLIAVMPVKNLSSDVNSGLMLRAKLVEELYFKGYARVPVRLIDEKLAGISTGSQMEVSAQVVGEILKVDAALYTTLSESRVGSGILYASTVVEARFELRSTKTGEILWSARHQETYHNFGISRKNLELQSSQVFEKAIEDVINRALETLPDGTDASGS